MRTVKAICVRPLEGSRSGSLEALVIETRPAPSVGPGQVRVRVAAAGVNRADVLQRKGRYPAPPGTVQDVLGLEFSGTVAECGDGVFGVEVGDRVMGLVPGGAMAGELVTHFRELIPVPPNLSLTEAAAVPEAFITAYDGLVLQGQLKLGETVLIHAAASGIGTAASQLAKAHGARVVGTSRTKKKLERCVALDHALVVEEGRFAAAVQDAVGRVELVFDCVGAAYLEENLRVLARQGRLVVYGLLGGATQELSLATLMTNRILLRGTVLRSRAPEERMALAQRAKKQLIPLFQSGSLCPVIDEVLPMDKVAEAHRRLENNQTVGKLVLSWE